MTAPVDVAVILLPLGVAVPLFVAFRGGRPVVPVRSPRAAGPTPLDAVRSHGSRAVDRLWRSPRAAEAVADDVPDVVELMLVAAASGGNVRRVVEVAVSRSEGPAGELLRRALHDVWAGHRLGEALFAILDDLDARTAEVIRPVASALVDCDHYGTPLVPTLQRLADDLRIHRQRRAEAKARRVPVRLLLPLVLCVLPSFALLTVAPLFAGMARDALADQNAPFEGTNP